MVSEERKAELANEFSYMLERHIDKQWIDSDIKDNIAENDEEKEFLLCMNFSVQAHY